MNKPEYPKLVLALKSQTERSPFDHELRLSLTVTPLLLGEDGKVTNPNYTGYDEAGEHALDGLVVSAINNAEDVRDRGSRVFGQSVEYKNVYSIDLRHAQAMVSVLSRIKRGMEKLELRDGSPATFSSYVLRVANVIGAKSFLVWNAAPRVTYDRDYTFLRPEEARTWIDTQGTNFAEQCGGKLAAPAVDLPASAGQLGVGA